MSVTNILWGQMLLVSLVVLGFIWAATEWTAWLPAFQRARRGVSRGLFRWARSSRNRGRNQIGMAGTWLGITTDLSLYLLGITPLVWRNIF
jgi:hypothetical protein